MYKLPEAFDTANTFSAKIATLKKSAATNALDEGLVGKIVP